MSYRMRVRYRPSLTLITEESCASAHSGAIPRWRGVREPVNLERARGMGGENGRISQRTRTRHRRHSHGGTGCGSAHKPFIAFRASFSNLSSTVFPGAYLRYHQHQPCLTSE